MPEVNLDIGGRIYRLGCGEGEEDRLIALAAKIDAEAAGLIDKIGPMPEGRLMLMTALMLADKLDDAEKARDSAEARATEAEEVVALTPDLGEAVDPEREAALAGTLNSLAARVETLVERIEVHH